ncbi:alpha/beta fold hydrolase [Paraburkholderia caribensis]|uniref:alpha/beta fold hydrolase n=1 Tax=Paraburkholderia caribensis TaxID=75105 RepID=UPI001CAE7FD4|nr:alpha/beta hydrolase [Paraburkholderia caribensis]CAG9242149.1 Pimeloyl-ACP methyl ester carboxylesterase [Paraburkholderia caribensis]
MAENLLDSWKLDQRFDFRGHAVRYKVSGQGSSPLVFVHGWPFSSFVWRRIAHFFEKAHRIYMYDLLAYGQSEIPANEDTTLEVQSELLAALYDHWGFGKDSAPDMVAHDIGGCTALRAHLLNGCEYRTLTLIDPVAVGPWGSPFVKHARLHLEAFAGMPEYIHKAIVEAYIGAATTLELRPEELSAYANPWLSKPGAAEFYRQIANLDQRYTDDIEDMYGDVRCPTQIVWGEDDKWIPIADGRRLAEKIPNASFHPIPHAGHLVQADAPEAVVYAVANAVR